MSFLLFICNHLKTKVFSTTGTSHLMTGSSVKSIAEVTFLGKCLWLMYIICLTLFSFFVSDRNTFRRSFLYFRLKDFNCYDSFVPVPFIKLGHLGHSLTSRMEIVRSDVYINNLFGHDHTNEFIDSFRNSKP